MRISLRKISIKTRLVLIISLTVLAVLVGQSLAVYFQSKAIVEEMAFSAAREQAQLNAATLEAWIRGKGEKLAILSKTSVIKDMDWAEQYPILLEIVTDEKDLEAMFVAGPDGQAKLTTRETISISDRNYFQEALRTGKIAYSQPTVSRVTGATTVMIAQPIVVDGKVVGILGATLLLDYLQTLVGKMNINGYGHGWIIGENGVTLAHPNLSYIGNQIVYQGNQLLRSLADEMMQGREGLGFYELDGVRKGLAYAPVQVTNWSIAMTANSSDVLASVTQIRNYSLITTLLAILIGAIIAYIAALFIARPIIKLRDLVAQVADGDLTVEVELTNEDEIGQLGLAMNTMVSNLRMLIGAINEATEQLNASTEQLSANCEESAASAEETAATMNEIAGTVQQVVANIQTISEGSSATARHASLGNEGVNKVTNQMGSIAESSRKTAESIKHLHTQTREINQIIGLINSFADQTNLLALNATIEAARAGEYGRGFAVVADEVRKLAEQSAQATASIQALVGSIQSESGDVVNLTELSEREVGEGSLVVKAVGDSFLEIVQGVQQLSGQFAGVLAATQQMAAGIEQVAAASQEQTASSEEVAAATESLRQMSHGLNDMVRRFRV